MLHENDTQLFESVIPSTFEKKIKKFFIYKYVKKKLKQYEKKININTLKLL
jgi:hypothetical protein